MKKQILITCRAICLTLLMAGASATLSGQSWTQRGSDIDGEAFFNYSGWSVAFSSDGNTVAIGAKYNNAGVSGHVRVYVWNNGTSAWVQRGSDIDGEAAGDESGSAVALSSDGNTVAIGAQQNDGTASNAGHVRVYDWNSGTSAWVKRGSDIDGEAAGDNSGSSVALSSDGNTVAIGAAGNDGTAAGAGHVRVYVWNSGTSAWVQRGSDIDGEAADDFSGYAIALSSDGNTLAIGALQNDGTADNSGHVRVYTYGSAPAPSCTGTATWDGGGADQSAFTKENWSGDVLPCNTKNVLFNATSNKWCTIGDTLELGDFNTTTAYSGRIKVEAKNTIINADDMDLKGAYFSVENQCGKISCDSFSLTFNGYAESSGAGMDVASMMYVRGSIFSGRSNAILNLNHFYLDRNGVFHAPSNNGVVNCSGNFSRDFASTFNPRTGSWNFTGNQNSNVDFGLATTNPVRIQFNNLSIAKTDSNTISVTNNDTIQVNGNFVLSGTNSRVQGGILNAKGNITMGKAWQDGAFNRVLITGTNNQTITCDTANEFSETVVLQKPSGRVLLGKDLSLGSVRFNSGILDPNGKKFILTGNDISGQNNSSNIKDRAYVLKTNGAFSGNSITVPLSKGDGLSLNSISLNTSGTHNDWQLDYVAANPNTIDGDLNSDLASISSTGYWRVQRLSSGAGSAETFLKILAGSGFDRVALLDGGVWRSIGGSVSGSTITSTEGSLFATTGDWYITAGVGSAPGAVNHVVADKDVISGEELELETTHVAREATAMSGGVDINGIHIYPNPAHESLNIQLPEGATRYTISDLSGRVLSSHNAGQTKLNLSNLSEGMYLLSTEVNGVKYSVRFVKGD